MFFFLYAGNQFDNKNGKRYLILPDDFKGSVPAQFNTAEIVRATSNTAATIVRFSRQDPANPEESDLIKGLLKNTTLTPLSRWLENGGKGVKRNQLAIVRGGYKIYANMPALTSAQVDKQSAEDFFTLLHLVLNDSTMSLIRDSQKEKEILSRLGRLGRLGIGEGRAFEWSNLDKSTQAALNAGFKAGYQKVKIAARQRLVDMNGWKLLEDGESRAAKHGSRTATVSISEQ